MRERRAAPATLLGVLVLAGLATSGAVARGRAPAPAAVATDCADPLLPAAILDGPGPLPGPGLAPLEVVEARAPHAVLHLAVADDEATRELGLMCVTRLRAHAGMVFVFPKAANQEFWMKLTLVPLDMVWVEPDGTVSDVAADVPASTRATSDAAVARRRGYGAYVVELPANEAKRDGLSPGARLVLPALRTR